MTRLLGRERMRGWVLSAERFEKLQGDDAAFGQVLAEAKAALADATRIHAAPAYASRGLRIRCGVVQASGPGRESPIWPGTTKSTQSKRQIPPMTS